MQWLREVGLFEIVFLCGLLGQAAMARLAGMRVEVFSFGYGPRLARVGRVQLAAFPIGGYIRVAGLHPTEGTVDGGDRGAFFNRPLPLRALVVLGWPIGAVLLIIAGTAASSMVFGRASVQTSVVEVTPGSAAEAAGVLSGDEILTVDGVSVAEPGELGRRVSASRGRPLVLEVQRGGGRLALPVTAREEEPGAHRIGARLVLRASRTRATLPEAIIDAAGTTCSRLADIARGVVTVVTDSEEAELRGPAGITEMTASAADPGRAADLAILFGVHLVAYSLIPIPPMPVGQLLLVLLGWRSRRRRSAEAARELGVVAATRQRMPPVLLVAILPLLAAAGATLFLWRAWDGWSPSTPWSAIVPWVLPHLLLAGALALRLPRAWAWGVFLPPFLLPSLLVVLGLESSWMLPLAFLLLATPATLLLPSVCKAFRRQCPHCHRLAAAPVRSSPRTSCLACGSGYATR